MRRIRIGNDININVSVTRDGAKEDFTGKTVSVFLDSPVRSYPISNFTINENVISFPFLGSIQKDCGDYSVTVKQEWGDNQNISDTCAAFKIVEHSYMTGGSDNYDVYVETIDAYTNVSTGNGVDDYEFLSNKPKINDVVLVGNKSLQDIGAQPEGDYALRNEIPDISNLVEKEDGKGLSTNDFTTELKDKLENVKSGAEKLGDLLNVGNWANIAPLKDRLLIQLKGESVWRSIDVVSIAQAIGDEINIPIIRRDDEVEGTDDDVFSSLRTLLEIANRSLSRQHSDTAAEVIEFLKGLKSLGNVDIGDFIGGLTGQGARINPNGSIEARSLTLWEFLEVPEIRYNRIEVIAGTSWRTKGGGIIESVTVNPYGVTGTVVLKLEDGDIGRVAVDDLCMGIWHYPEDNDSDNYDDGIGNYRFSGFGTSYFRITAVRGDRNTEFDFTLRALSSNYIRQYLPQPGMHFAQFGNPTDTDRQSSVYDTPEYSRILVGVTTWEYSKANVSMQWGDLSNLSAFGFDTTGLGSLYANNVLLTGTIDQSATMPDRLEFSSDNGFSIALNETTTVTATIMNTWTDVTDTYERFDWTRDSGNSVEDAAWNALHTDVSNHLTLAFSDLPAERTMFTITAYKPGAQIEGQIIV